MGQGAATSLITGERLMVAEGALTLKLPAEDWRLVRPARRSVATAALVGNRT